MVPTLLPSAHGDNCRVYTTISAGVFAAIFDSPVAAIGVSFVLCLCPKQVLWWPTDEDTDSITLLLQELLKWMDAHNDVLPVITDPTNPEQIEANTLRKKYNNYKYKYCKKKKIELPRAQQVLQDEIDRRATLQKNLDTLEEIERWSTKNQ